MYSKIGGKGSEIAYVVNAFFESPDKARCQAHPPNTKTAQFRRKIDVFGMSRGHLGLVHRDLDLPILSCSNLRQMSIHLADMGDSAAIFDSSTHQNSFIK